MDPGVAAGRRRRPRGRRHLPGRDLQRRGAPPEHHYHQKAARAVLKALLPESGTDIKGHMRSEAELLAVSGYAGRPQDFDGLLHILDSEVRLITPTEAEETTNLAQPQRQPGGPAAGSSLVPETGAPPVPKYYQLTHDYLVPSLRDWLTRKLRETRRGRAALRLGERTALWSGQPENRFLPPSWEWLTMRLLTRPRDWTTPERSMMGRAARYYAARGLLVFAGLVVLALAGREVYGRQRAQVLQDRLLAAAIEGVPEIVREMEPYRSWLDGPLRGPRPSRGRRRFAPAVERKPRPASGRPGAGGIPVRPSAHRIAAGNARHPCGLATGRERGGPAALGGP